VSSAAHGRFNVLVLPRVIEAENREAARRELINLLMERPSLVQVYPAGEDIYVEGNDAIGI